MPLFYVGQTNNLSIRLQEHRDGQQFHTRGRDPKLVYFKAFVGNRREVNEWEDGLTGLCQTASGRRRLMEMIEEFRTPLRLLDLEA